MVLKKLLDKLSRLGFTIHETMTGTHQFHPYGVENHFMEFTLDWGPSSFGDWLTPSSGSSPVLAQACSGYISVDGLVCHAPCYGTLVLDYFGDHKLRYELHFQDNLGHQYTYCGEKVNIQPWNLLTSHTTCFGTITEDRSGYLVSRSVLRFKLRTIPAFLWSFRLQAD